MIALRMGARRMVSRTLLLVTAFLLVVAPTAGAAVLKPAENQFAVVDLQSSDYSVVVDTKTGDALSVLPSSLVMRPTADDGPAGQTQGICTTGEGSANKALPVNRWADGTNLHSRLRGKLWEDTAAKVQRDGVMSMMVGIGNAVWGLTTGLVEASVAFCPLKKFGGTVDQAAASLGKAMLSGRNSVILTMMISFVGMTLVFRLLRSGAGPGAVKTLITKAAVVGLMFLMLAGSVASTGGTPNEKWDYKPGFGSPGWFASTVDNTISRLAQKPAATLLDGINDSSDELYADSAAGTPLSCDTYIEALHDQYSLKYGTGRDAEVPATAPIALSSMWEMTGLRAWIMAQTGSANGHGNYMYCRILDAHAEVPVRDAYSDQMDGDGAVANGSLSSATIVGTLIKADGRFSGQISNTAAMSLAMMSSSDNREADRAFIAWAACRLKDSNPANFDNPNGWSITGSRKNLIPSATGSGTNSGVGQAAEKAGLTDTGGTATASVDQNEASQACYKIFNDPGYDGDYFDWRDGDNTVNERSMTPGARDFIRTLHGTNNKSGIAASFIYIISAFSMLLVFGGMAIAIFIAKVAALVIIMFAFLFLLMLLAPNADISKLGQAAKQYIGLSLFAFGAQALMSMVVLLTSVFIQIGASIVSSPALQMMWAAVAPIVAVLALHLFFKKMRIPSPFKPSAGLAYGQMAWSGAMGAAAGAGAANMMSRGEDKLTNGLRSRVNPMSGGARKAPNGQNAGNGSHKMTPGEAPKEATESTEGSSDEPEVFTPAELAEAKKHAAETGPSRAEQATDALGGAVGSVADKAKSVGGAAAHPVSAVKSAGARVKSEFDVVRTLGAKTYASGMKHQVKTAAKYGAVGTAALATGGLAGVAFAGVAAKGVQRHRSTVSQRATNGGYTDRQVAQVKAYREARAANDAAAQAEQAANEQAQQQAEQQRQAAEYVDREPPPVYSDPAPMPTPEHPVDDERRP